MSDFLARYNARKNGAPPRPGPPPPPQYQQQPVYPSQPVPVQPQQPPPGYSPGYAPQPLPGAPPHAPYGYDPATGVPVAPYGYDPSGRVLVGQPYAQQPVQQPQWQPNGLPAPQGYGQPPHGQVQVQPLVQPDQTTYIGEDGQVRIDWAQAPKAWQGGQGVRETQPCGACGGDMIPTDAPNTDGMPGASVGVFNATLGRTVYPAAHCSRCGAIQKEGMLYAPGNATGALAGGAKVSGPARPAPGGGSEQQVAHQHGLTNIFAPS